MKQRPDKGLSWWAFIRFSFAHERACLALQKLNRLAKLTGCLGVGIQAGIAEEMLRAEFEPDADIWSRRKAFGSYERRGLPIPRECLEAELRHAERLEKTRAK